MGRTVSCFVNPRANPDRVVTTDFCLFQDAVWIILLDAATETACLSSQFLRVFSRAFHFSFQLSTRVHLLLTLTSTHLYFGSRKSFHHHFMSSRVPHGPCSQARQSTGEFDPSGRITIHYSVGSCLVTIDEEGMLLVCQWVSRMPTLSLCFQLSGWLMTVLVSVFVTY